MANSLGGAYMERLPVVFTVEGRTPQVLYSLGDEAKVLALMEKMKLITRMVYPEDVKEVHANNSHSVQKVQSHRI